MKTKNKSKLIVADIALQREIVEKLKISYPSVRHALNFKTKEGKSDLIRAYALAHGAKLFEETENPYKREVLQTPDK